MLMYSTIGHKSSQTKSQVLIRFKKKYGFYFQKTYIDQYASLQSIHVLVSKPPRTQQSTLVQFVSYLLMTKRVSLNIALFPYILFQITRICDTSLK